MRLKVIGCDSLARLVYHCAAHSPHTVDVMLFPLGPVSYTHLTLPTIYSV